MRQNMTSGIYQISILIHYVGFFDNMARLIFENLHREEPVVVFNLDPVLLSRRDPFYSTPNTNEVTIGAPVLKVLHTWYVRFNPIHINPYKRSPILFNQ